jgi:hypothetical protein
MKQLSKSEWRKRLLKEGNAEWENLEKILLTVVGGTLAATITFFTISNIVFVHKTLLKYSWTCLGLSLVALMLSYLASESYTLDLMRKVRDDDREQLTDEEVEELASDVLSNSIVIFNWLSIITAVAGMILLAFFGYANLG